MSKYSIYATKQDYEKAYETLRELDFDNKFDWKKIKRTSLNSLMVLIDGLKRHELTKSNLLTYNKLINVFMDNNTDNDLEIDKYFDSIELLMSVVEKIEGMNYSSEMNYLPGLGHRLLFFSGGAEVSDNRFCKERKESIFYAVVKVIEYINRK